MAQRDTDSTEGSRNPGQEKFSSTKSNESKSVQNVYKYSHCNVSSANSQHLSYVSDAVCLPTESQSLISQSPNHLQVKNKPSTPLKLSKFDEFVLHVSNLTSNVDSSAFTRYRVQKLLAHQLRRSKVQFT